MQRRLRVLGRGVSSPPSYTSIAAVEVTVTIEAVAGFDQHGQQRRVTRSVPSTLVSHIQRQSSRSARRPFAAPGTAGVVHRDVDPPQSVGQGGHRRVVGDVGQPPPSADLRRPAVRAVARRATATTWKPRSASVRAVASPIPALAPVTTTANGRLGLPSSSTLVTVLLCRACRRCRPSCLFRAARVVVTRPAAPDLTDLRPLDPPAACPADPSRTPEGHP